MLLKALLLTPKYTQPVKIYRLKYQEGFSIIDK